MIIYINYFDKKYVLEIDSYESIDSIINKYINLYNINDDPNNYFLDYNGLYLNKKFCLDKYNIKDNYILNLNKKKKGGDNSLFFKIIYYIVAIQIVLVLTPLLIQTGFIPTLASLLKFIIDNGVGKFCKYLLCKLGKITLYRRVKLIILIIKYVIFILMIYVIITFPLIIWCITIKGHTIKDDPNTMCSAISTGNLAGMILTFGYILIYLMLRCGNYVLNFLIKLCKKQYYLNMNIVPILTSMNDSYNEVKYIIVYLIPYIGGAQKGYHKSLKPVLDTFKMVLSLFVNFGCNVSLNKIIILRHYI